MEETELKVAQKEAYSLKGSQEGMKIVGSTDAGKGRVYIFLKDENGEYWYQTQFRHEDKLISEEEFVFGKKLEQARKTRKSW